MRIGIDIGGVVIGGPGNDTQFFTDDYLKTPAMKSARMSITTLNRLHEVVFISKAGPKTAAKTKEWLFENAFFWKAGVSFDQLVFCRERWQKAPIAQMLELDVFIDDRKDICDSMREVGIIPIQHTSWEQTKLELEFLTASEMFTKLL